MEPGFYFPEGFPLIARRFRCEVFRMDKALLSVRPISGGLFAKLTATPFGQTKYRSEELFFASDNWAGAHEKINENILKNTTGKVSGYNGGELDRKVEGMLSDIFERDVAVFFVATGTAANSLAIAASGKPGSVAFCHHEAHVNVDECGAPEFFSGGRLCGVSGKLGKIDKSALLGAMAMYPKSFVHHGRPGAVTLTQSTEIGTLYSLEEIRELSEIAQAHDIPLHMDGARFANGLAAMDVSPAEMTWKAGVDFLSFGGTKNGCWCAEALICFDEGMREEMAFHHKRAGQLFSKSRFVSAQFEAYLEGGLWLDLAKHANAMTRELAEQLNGSSSVRLAWQPQANESFVIMAKSKAEALRKKGAAFFEWAVPVDHAGILDDGEDLYRLVTSFATTPDEVAEFVKLAAD